MDNVRKFLESSSICGFSHISASKTIAEKLFWVGVVAASFAVTAYLTTGAFVDWAKYPIATTTETFPISGVQFPKIVVCPPRVPFSFTLNYEIIHEPKCSCCHYQDFYE